MREVLLLLSRLIFVGLERAWSVVKVVHLGDRGRLRKPGNFQNPMIDVRVDDLNVDSFTSQVVDHLIRAIRVIRVTLLGFDHFEGAIDHFDGDVRHVEHPSAGSI